MFVIPTSAMARNLGDRGIPTVSDAGIHHPTTIVGGNVVGQYLSHGVPVAGREVRLEALVRSACRVFQLRRRTTELVEPRERGVEVGLVEHLAAVDQVAFDHHKLDVPPLGVEALSRRPIRRVSDDRSEVGQPMHRLDVALTLP